MINEHIPVAPFHKLTPTTMTIVVPLRTKELDTHGIYVMLTTVKTNLTMADLKIRQGKYIYPPEVCIPGEIVGCKYENQCKGLIQTNKDGFPTSITLKIGTSCGIVSMKLSETIELTGPPSLAIAQEAVTHLLNKVRDLQAKCDIIRDHKDKLADIVDDWDDWVMKEKTDILDITVWQLVSRYDDSDTQRDFLATFLIPYPCYLYKDMLEQGPMQTEMINVPFDLGCTINQYNLYRIMKNDIFVCNFNNIRENFSLFVQRYDTKVNNRGETKYNRLFFKVNRSGYVMYSGANLAKMEYYYYVFFHKIYTSELEIQSREIYDRKIKIRMMPCIYNVEQWKEKLDKEKQFKQLIINKDKSILKHGYKDH